MATKREGVPFFRDFDAEIITNDRNHEAAKNKLIARNAVFYKKTLFQAFLHLSDKQIENMTMQEYLDYCVIFKDAILILHAPYVTKTD